MMFLVGRVVDSLMPAAAAPLVSLHLGCPRWHGFSVEQVPPAMDPLCGGTVKGW